LVNRWLLDHRVGAPLLCFGGTTFRHLCIRRPSDGQESRWRGIESGIENISRSQNAGLVATSNAAEQRIVTYYQTGGPIRIAGGLSQPGMGRFWWSDI